MKTCMRKSAVLLWTACIACGTPGAVLAQDTPPSESSREGTLPIGELIASVAQSTGKKFVVDPRVRAEVTLIGQSPDDLTYAELLIVLQVHGFAAVENGGYVQIVPDVIVRALPTPLVADGETRADAEFVNRIIPVRSMPAMMLVPLLRPLLPQQAHLVAVSCSNVLLIADTFANVKRIETLVQNIDTGNPYTPGDCTAPPAPDVGAHAQRSN